MVAKRKKKGQVKNLEWYILTVLENEVNNKNRFLSDTEIAYRVNGLRYADNQEGSLNYQPRSIRSRMPKVREIADEQQRTIIGLRRSRKDIEKDGNKVVGWKIASLGDEKFIREEIALRRTLSEGNHANASKISVTAKKTGLMADNDQQKIS